METDPFLTTPGAALTHGYKPKPRRMGFGQVAAVLIAIPWVIFSLINLAFVFIYHIDPSAAFVIVLGCFGLSCIFLVLYNRSDRRYQYLGMLCLLATVFGTFSGLYNYDANLGYYWRYAEGRKYHNVVPSEPASSHTDAGMMEFTSTTELDKNEAVGYQAMDGHTYCIVPVKDASVVSQIEYWAVGVDCCNSRLDFKCDDADDHKARGGVVIYDSAFGLTKTPFDYYSRAMRQAEAEHELTSSSTPMFVRWVRSTETVQQNYWSDGSRYLLIILGVYLLVSAALGITLSLVLPKSMKVPGLAV